VKRFRERQKWWRGANRLPVVSCLFQRRFLIVKYLVSNI
jgi:hypothetical protein